MHQEVAVHERVAGELPRLEPERCGVLVEGVVQHHWQCQGVVEVSCLKIWGE